MPGQQLGGPINSKSVAQFVAEARTYCRESDRLEVCDSILGGMVPVCGMTASSSLAVAPSSESAAVMPLRNPWNDKPCSLHGRSEGMLHVVSLPSGAAIRRTIRPRL